MKSRQRRPAIYKHVLALSLAPSWAVCSPTTGGQTGIINMPDGRIEEDGTWRIGVSNYDPYSIYWTSITALPRLELSGRYTVINDAPTNLGGGAYGDYKDKAFDAKLNLLRESTWLPSFSIGTQDFIGTQLFTADYLAMSKQVGRLDATLGYGRKRIDGAFGGLSLALGQSWKLISEYDAYDYAHDYAANISGATERSGGATYGIQYTWGWLSAQVSNQDGTWGVNAYMSVPLMRKEFIPKIEEPPPFVGAGIPGGDDQWTTQSGALRDSLTEQGYKNLTIELNDNTLAVAAAHDRISLPGRTAGRAIRTMERFAPDRVENLRYTLTENDAPLFTYRAISRAEIAAYFQGGRPLALLEPYVEFWQPSPNDAATQAPPSERSGVEPSDTKIEVSGTEGHMLQIKSEDANRNAWSLVPFNLSFFFNDPSGAVHYDIFATGSLRRRLDTGLFFTASARLTLFEDVSDVTQPSNSLLPHVRTDVAEYKHHGPFKLDQLLLNKYLHLATATYGRVSAGLYEEMFGGAGGQILFAPYMSRWSTDLTIDWLRQRDYSGGFDFLDYSVVSALGAVHYRVPVVDITATLRGGRFLAKDDGVRIELKRRFRSGFEFGAWYTRTNGEDITSPGTPDSPYYDKGIFMTIPLRTMLTKDTRAIPKLSLAPWTRDVGQMVRSPGDLYDMVEDRMLLNSTQDAPMSDFGQ